MDFNYTFDLKNKLMDFEMMDEYGCTYQYALTMGDAKDMADNIYLMLERLYDMNVHNVSEVKE